MLPPKLVDLYEHFNRGNNRYLDWQQLESLLLSLCGSFNRTFLLIDALDESTVATERRMFLSTINALQKASVKAFITSRPNLDDINTELDQVPQVKIVASESDIRRYLTEKVKENSVFMKRISSASGLEEKIIDTIASRASGM